MNKIRTALFPLIASILIVGIAILPQTAAYINDAAIQGEVKYGTIQTIQLQLDSNTETVSSPMMKKMAMMRHSMYSIAESHTTMTRKDVLAAIDNELAPYYENGLMFNEWDSADKSLSPYIAYGTDTDYCLFWEVAFSLYSDGGYYNLNVYVDDETGKLVHISYQTAYLCFKEEERYERIKPLTEIYFQSLGMEASADYWETNGLVEDISSDSAGTAALRYTFGDVIYGEVVVEFYIHETGFYVYLPR